MSSGRSHCNLCPSRVTWGLRTQVSQSHLTWREDVMAAMTLLCDLGAPAVTALMLSNEATISPPHFFVSLPGEGTHEISQPSLGHSTHTPTATCTVSSTLRLRQTPGMPSSKCGYCNRTGWTSRGVGQVAGEDTCSHRGMGEPAQPAAEWPIRPMRAM